MTVEQFRSSLVKGLGRAVLFITPDSPQEYLDVLAEACLNDFRYEGWTEAGRGPYLYEMLERTNMTELMLPRIIDQIPAEEHSGTRDQLFGLMMEYCRRGNEQAKQEVYRQAAAGNELSYDLLAEMGIEGITFLVENVIPAMPQEDRWQISGWLESAEKYQGTSPIPPHVITFLKDEVQRVEEWRTSRDGNRSRESLTAREALDKLDDISVPRYGKSIALISATDEELLEAAEKYLQVTTRNAGLALKKVFERRPFPLAPERLLERVHEEDLGDLFLDTLGTLEGPAIHQLALDQLKLRPLPSGVLGALRSTFEASDVAGLREVLPLLVEVDDWDLHDAVTNTLYLVPRMTALDQVEFLEWIYENSNCAYCRLSAVTHLAEQGTLTDDIRSEARFDAEPEIRDLANAP